LKHVLTIEEGEKLETCSFEDADVGSDLYVPFEEIMADNDVKTSFYLGKVLEVRRADEDGLKVLKFAWANGDDDQEIEEAELPEGQKMKHAHQSRMTKRTIEQKTCVRRPDRVEHAVTSNPLQGGEWCSC